MLQLLFMDFFSKKVIKQTPQGQINQKRNEWRSLLEESRYHGDHLEEQINDMMELHQQEVVNMKQVISTRAGVWDNEIVCYYCASNLKSLICHWLEVPGIYRFRDSLQKI